LINAGLLLDSSRSLLSTTSSAASKKILIRGKEVLPTGRMDGLLEILCDINVPFSMDPRVRSMSNYAVCPDG
jgi:hypothetical protein